MKILVLGGDARQIYCAGRLSLEPGIKVQTLYLKEDDDKSLTDDKPDVIVLPYVTLKDGLINCQLASKSIRLHDVYGLIKSGTIIFAGGLPNTAVKEIESLGATVFDWFSDEELTHKNAFLTAEGAAQIIVGRSRKAVSGSKILVIGWGRVAKACAGLFKAMGAEVAAAARKESAREEIKANGFECADFISSVSVSVADVIVNTVPANVIGRKELESMRDDCWILELASKPYGVDFSLAGSVGREVVLGAGLPGKYTPESCGRFMAESVINQLRKGGDWGG